MFEIVLAKPRDGQAGADRIRLTDGLKMASVQPKVYRTFVSESSMARDYVFVTTSKDVHLGLGRLDMKNQRALARVLENEFASLDYRYSQALLYVDGNIGEDAWLVTRSSGVCNEKIFTLTPAH